MLTKQETLLGRGSWEESRRVRDPRGLLCHVAHSLGFYGDGIVPGLFLANHADSESFLVVHTLLSQDGFQRGGF